MASGIHRERITNTDPQIHSQRNPNMPARRSAFMPAPNIETAELRSSAATCSRDEAFADTDSPAKR